MLSCVQFGSQIFLPALPNIADHFAMSKSDTQQIMMLYYVSFGLSQLVFGPWSDNSGRRKIFLTGQSFFILGSLCCVLATTPTMLAIGRVLQGFGAGAPLIVSRTLLIDVLKGNKLKQAFGSLAIAASSVAVLAPSLGGWITTTSNWKILFFIVTIYLTITWLIGFKLLPRQITQSKKTSVSLILSEFSQLICDSRFLTLASFKWLPNLLFLICVTFFPFEFQQKFSISTQEYGFYITLSSCGLIVGAVLAKFAQKHISQQNILALFWPLILMSGLGFYFMPLSLFNTLVCYSLFMICAGAFYPSCLQLVIKPFPKQAGTVNALLSSIDMFVFSLIAILVNKYWIVDIKSLGELFLLISFLLVVSWWLMRRTKIKTLKISN